MGICDGYSAHLSGPISPHLHSTSLNPSNNDYGATECLQAYAVLSYRPSVAQWCLSYMPERLCDRDHPQAYTLPLRTIVSLSKGTHQITLDDTIAGAHSCHSTTHRVANQGRDKPEEHAC